MEIVTPIAEPILSQVGESLIEFTKRHVRYVFRHKCIVENLFEEYQKLESAHDRIQNDVDNAIRNTEKIEKDVEKWLEDVTQVLKDVEELKKEIERNKPCFGGWCANWCWRYRLSRKVEHKRSIMLKLRESGKFNQISRLATLPGIEFLAPTDFELFMSSKSVSNQIIEALKDDKINMVGLYGMGGVGKTTLAKAVGIEVNKEIFDEVVMVAISQTPDFQKIQNELAESLDLELKKDSEVQRAKQLYVRFTRSGKKILVILDDVWKAFNLKEKIGIPSNEDHKGCKVLLTTRSEQVCIDMNCQEKIQVNVLNEEEGLTLLKKHAGISDDSSIWNDLAVDVAGECCGLPLALVVIGRALKGKPINDWKLMSQKLKDSKLEDIPINVPEERGIYGCLKLSYDNLKGEKTKLCFLLCSLFPEDYRIKVDDLVKIAIGLGLFKDARSIEAARTELLSTLGYLKHSCLLLDAGEEEYVKMHDLVRDVALWIASKGEHVFMIKIGMESMEWSNVESWDQYTAISCLNNKIEELPVGLVCPKLNFLWLTGEVYGHMLKVSDECFKEMKALKVMTLYRVDMSLKSLQFLTNLRTLELISCNLRDISSLSKLNKLEILSFRSSSFNELPRELSELRKLRILNLCFRGSLEIIPCNFLLCFPQLEELYIGHWRIEGTSAERGNAILSELSSLSRLVVLELRINATCFPEDFDSVCRKLLRYDIRVNTSPDYSTSRQNAFRIRDIEASSLIAFKGLHQALEYLLLEKVIGCQNILPTIDQGRLNKLNSLSLVECEDLKCIIDMSQQQVLATTFSNLVELSLRRLICLREICYGASLSGRFLNKLEKIYIEECPNMRSLFPAMMLQGICKLKKVEISSCDKLEEVFQLDGLCHTGEENLAMLSSFAELKLRKLPLLRCIWKGPTHHVKSESLIDVEVTECNSLTYLFTLSLARSLVQLKSLRVGYCKSLKHLIMTKGGDNNKGEFEASGHDIVLPKLKILNLKALENLIKFCDENYNLTWPALEDFTIDRCPNLSTSIIGKVQDLQEKLQSLCIGGCKQLYNIVISGLKDGFFTNLKELNIKHYEVDVVFQLEGLIIDGQQHILSLPNLKTLTLESLPQLEDLCKSLKHVLSLENITTLEIKYCNRLRHIFSPALARNLLQLQNLYIICCKELEEIIIEDDEEYQTLPKDHPQPLFFQNLSQMEVVGCPKLRRLFPITIARGLQNLKRLRVRKNSQLEEIFGDKYVTDVIDHKEIVLPQLNWMVVEELPSLTNFCPVRYHFVFPSLKELLIVGECPKIRTRFSLAQDKSVHAKSKAPKIGKEDETSEPSIKIKCLSFYEMQETLPRYIENDKQSITQQEENNNET